jgi:galactokinase
LIEDRTDVIEKTAGHFKKQFTHNPDLVVAAPGRSNLIGEHTDYNDGHVLPIAINRFTAAAASNRSDKKFRLYTANLEKNYEFDLRAIPEKRPQWVSYIMGLAVELERDGFDISGKDIVVFGNVPIGSGLSSSAALEISVGTVIERLDGLDIDDPRLVNLCRNSNRNWVGVNCGPMDQYASRACRSGHAGLLDCRSLEMTHHSLPQGIEYLSIYSGIPRSLAASEYNERAASCQKAVDILRRQDKEIKALRDVTIDMVDSARKEMGGLIYRRAKHVVTEQKRVYHLVEAMKTRDLLRIARILSEGHRSLSENYDVSLPVLDEMIEWLYDQPGIVGARLTGAGFGGSLVGLILTDTFDVEKMKCNFIANFKDRTPEPPEIWKLNTVDGAKYQ